MSDEFEDAVQFLMEMYQGWLVNLQKDAYAEGAVLSPEVIAEAFGRLRAHYDILWKKRDIDSEYRDLFDDTGD